MGAQVSDLNVKGLETGGFQVHIGPPAPPKPKPPPPPPPPRNAYGPGPRASSWMGVYVVGFFFTAILCGFGFPSDCRPIRDPVEIFIELPVLMAFAVAQAWFCGILAEDIGDGDKRGDVLEEIKSNSIGLIVTVVFTFGAVSGLSAWGSPRDSFTVGQAVLSFIAALSALAAVSKNFAEGAHLVAHLPMKHGSPMALDKFATASLWLLFVVIIVYAALYATFALLPGGWEYHYILLAWVSSLLAQFRWTHSTYWLAVTTTVFLQGVGAYGFIFLWSSDWSFNRDSSDD